MTAVDQSKLYRQDGIHNGDCLVACLASLLDLELWMVPPFEQMYGRGHGQWRASLEKWLLRFFRLRLVEKAGAGFDGFPEFYIANGPAPRGVYHSVIYSRGLLIHDPHPSRSGLIEVEWTCRLEIAE